jgi:mannose-6-phosphate isomerase-like protein (cupin superfamily)
MTRGAKAAVAGFCLAALGTMAHAQDTPDWAAFQLDELAAQREAEGNAYLRFFDVPSMSLGLYELEAGAYDGQPVHERDEIYVVVQGSAVLLVGEEETPAETGSVIFVRAGVPHRFDRISEDIRVLVFFAPGWDDASAE